MPWQPSLAASAAGLRGHRLRSVDRRRKLLVLGLAGGSHLLVHPMTGELVVVDGARTPFAGGHPSRSMLEPMPSSTTRVVFRLDGDRALYFNDGRKFSRIRVVSGQELADDAFLARLGPEPLGDEFAHDGFRTRLARHARAPIKAVLAYASPDAARTSVHAASAESRLHCFFWCITVQTLSRRRAVTYVIGEPCIDVKDRSCVDVCPVDCIHEVGRMLVIDPEECIDCGACEPECPVEAIFPEDALPQKWHEFTAINAAFGGGVDAVDGMVADYCSRNELPAIEGQR